MMQIQMLLNEKKVTADIAPDMLLIDFLRSQGCYSVKRGCETSNCGLCTVLMDGTPVLSCSVLAARAELAEGLERYFGAKTAVGLVDRDNCVFEAEL